MATKLGVTPPADGELPFVTGGDYRYSFKYQNPPGTDTNFPAGTELYYLIGTDTPTQHDFVINAGTATIRIESDVADAIPAGTPFKLVFQEAGDPTTETPILTGKTSRA